jgi:hypothetical protein
MVYIISSMRAMQAQKHISLSNTLTLWNISPSANILRMSLNVVLVGLDSDRIT